MRIDNIAVRREPFDCTTESKYAQDDAAVGRFDRKNIFREAAVESRKNEGCGSLAEGCQRLA
jgi:hypothetical protein